MIFFVVQNDNCASSTENSIFKNNYNNCGFCTIQESRTVFGLILKINRHKVKLVYT